MHCNTADVIWVCLKVCYFLACVVVEDAKLEVIAAADDPVLAGDEAAGAHGDVRQFEGLDDAAGFEGPDVGVAAVQRREDPCCVRSQLALLVGGLPVDEREAYAQSGGNQCP